MSSKLDNVDNPELASSTSELNTSAQEATEKTKANDKPIIQSTGLVWNR